MLEYAFPDLLRDFNAFWRRKFQDLIDRYAAHITSNCIREPRIPADVLPDTQRCLSLHTCSRDEEVASLLTKVAPLAIGAPPLGQQVPRACRAPALAWTVVLVCVPLLLGL